MRNFIKNKSKTLFCPSLHTTQRNFASFLSGEEVKERSFSSCGVEVKRNEANKFESITRDDNSINYCLDLFEKYSKRIEDRFKKPRNEIKVIVGMSGGIDSSVTACLLKEMGFNVQAIHMRNWDNSEEDPDRQYCTFTKDWNDVKLISSKFNIPYVGSSLHPVEFIDEYWNDVFERLIEGYQEGITPNPDLFCNKFIKFDAMLNYAKQKCGADCIATGHYAQLETSNNNQNLHLLRAVDEDKDQSYFLAFVNPKAFESSIFPLGQYLKKEHVRRLARDYFKFPEELWAKKDSVGICFVGKRKFKDFLSNYVNTQEGNIVSIEDKQTILGKHEGIPFYTIGQSVGLSGMKNKWFVCEKDVKNNILYVCPGEHEILYRKECIISNCHWLEGNISPDKNYFIKIRYNQRVPMPCRLEPITSNSQQIKVTLLDDFKARAIAPGQVAVLYEKNDLFNELVCIGGGIYT
ncbi:hypothetical protein ABK040_014148 [Willaertia magna]